jgi:import inner membrane translocase subunit TIM8
MASQGAGQQKVSAELQQFLAQEQAKAQVRGPPGRCEHTHAHHQPLRAAAAHRPAARPARAQLQQTVSRLTDECWDKCISSPGSYLSSREQACLSNCARRFLDTTQFVVKYFASKGGGGGGGGGGDDFH